MTAVNARDEKRIVFAIVTYCRAGFEPETCEETAAWLEAKGIAVDERKRSCKSGDAYTVVHCSGAVAKLRALAFTELMFARQAIVALPQPFALGDRDRVRPIIEAAGQLAGEVGISVFQSVWVEYPDSNDGKSLSRLARRITPYLEKTLRERHLLDDANAHAPRLHVFMTAKSSAWVGCGIAGKSNDWPLGIVRLRMPAGAPSRSTLKLAEAFVTFLGDGEERALQPDMRAADLGAAPGGWTWQLIRRGIRVTAVDNADLSADLVDNAMVRHSRSDGFHYQPKQPVDWMVCDMVEKPSRIALLVGKWLAQGWARHTIFNLKLPMKKRLKELRRCEDIIRGEMDASRKSYILRFKQLYHDREEVTGYCSVVPRHR